MTDLQGINSIPVQVRHLNMWLDKSTTDSSAAALVRAKEPWLCLENEPHTFTCRTLTALEPVPISELGADQEFGVNARGLTLNVVDLWKRWHQSLRLLMWAQILSAGPSLMFMVDMRCSSFSSSRACPSISWQRNSSAISRQPAATHQQSAYSTANSPDQHHDG